MEGREVQRARTESAFREVNERIAENARRYEAGETEFVCECADVHCTERVQATLEEYERVRANPTTFLLAPGHGDRSIERLVERHRRFQIVEKIHHGARTLARRLDPRAAED